MREKAGIAASAIIASSMYLNGTGRCFESSPVSQAILIATHKANGGSWFTTATPTRSVNEGESQ